MLPAGLGCSERPSNWKRLAVFPAVQRILIDTCKKNWTGSITGSTVAGPYHHVGFRRPFVSVDRGDCPATTRTNVSQNLWARWEHGGSLRLRRK